MQNTYYNCYDLFHNEILNAWKNEAGKKPASVVIAEYIQAVGLHAYSVGDTKYASHCSKCISMLTNLVYNKPVKELVSNMLSVLDSKSKEYSTLSNADTVMRMFV